MIHIDLIEREEYTLLFIDTSRGKPFPIDIQKAFCPLVNGTKGLIISSPVPNWITLAIIFQYRNRCRWIAAYDEKIAGAVVFVSLSPDRIVGELIEVKLPCLKCWAEGKQTYLRAGAKHPYCVEHRDSAPHRH